MNNILDIDKLIKNSIKNKNLVETKVYRAIKSEILNYKTSKNAGDYTKESEINLIKRLVKQHQDSILQYKEAGRSDLVVEEDNELSVLLKLLPESVSDVELKNSILNMFNSNPENENCESYENLKIPKKQMGILIKDLKSKFPGNDVKQISDLIKQKVI